MNLSGDGKLVYYGVPNLSSSFLTIDVSISYRKGDVPNLTADPSLAEKELGFHAPLDLETMCRDLWNWQSKNPKGFAGL